MNMLKDRALDYLYNSYILKNIHDDVETHYKGGHYNSAQLLCSILWLIKLNNLPNALAFGFLLPNKKIYPKFLER